MEALDYWIFAVAVLSTPAFARVNLNFDVEVAPPPPREVRTGISRPGTGSVRIGIATDYI